MSLPSPTWVSSRESTFARLESCLAAAAARCPVASGLELRELLPPQASGERLLLIELIKYDLAIAAGLGLIRHLDFYLNDLGDLLPPGEVPVDLVIEAVQIRAEAGLSSDWLDYAERYPHLAEALRNLMDSPDVTLCGTNLEPLPDLQTGDRIGEFQILARLGQGAFARVYLARQDAMQRLVALKVTNRVSEEPQALSQLDHPNVIRVYDQRICDAPRVALLYMQFAPGGTLAECIRHCRQSPRNSWKGRHLLEAIDQALLRAGQSQAEPTESRRMLADWSWPTVVAWLGTQLAQGLGYAHRRGVLHRDVKPANILLTAEGLPKLADFNVSYNGLAGRAGAAAHFGGSLAYMAPEQLRVADPEADRTPDSLDARADLYSLAVVLWELWHGQRPWNDDDPIVDWSSLVRSELQMRRRGLPPAFAGGSTVERVLDQTLRQALADDPGDRPQSGEEFAGLLRLALYPEAARYFFPEEQHWLQRWLRWPAWVPIAVTTFPAIVFAAALNYVYNLGQIQAELPELWNAFQRVSLVVNGVAFPIGFVWFGQLLWRFVAAVRRSNPARSLNSADVEQVWNLGHEIAIRSGFLWLMAGLAFPIALSSLSRAFPFWAAASFFLSLILSGGIAIVYPFFGTSLLAVIGYYPRMVPRSLVDPEFASRSERLRRRSRKYLFAAAAIPLLALTLLVLRGGEGQRWILLATIACTGLGFAAAYFAVQRLDEALSRLKQIVSNEGVVRRPDTLHGE